MSLMVIPSQSPRILLISYEQWHIELFEIKDITNMRFTECESEYADKYIYRCGIIDTSDIYFDIKPYRKFDILAGNYQYMHKDVLLIYVNMRQPIYSLGTRLIHIISGFIPSTNNLRESGIWPSHVAVF